MGLKPNLTKCETAGIGALKGAQRAVYGMKFIDLCTEAIQILGTYLLYNSRMEGECNSSKLFQRVKRVKTLAISKSYSWKTNSCL